MNNSNTQSDGTIADIENPEIPEWQLKHLEKRLMSEVREEVQDMNFNELGEPDSQIQSLVKSVYEQLQAKPAPDEFDKFYENSELEEYTRKDLFAEFIRKVIDRLETSNSDIQDINELDMEKLKTEEGVNKALKTIADAVNSDSELKAVRQVIEEDSNYSELLEDVTGYMSKDEYIDKQKSFIRDNLERLAKGLEPRQEFEDYFEDFRAMNNNEIDDVATRLNQIYDIGISEWKLVLYSVLSASAPKFTMNGRKVRSSLHTLLMGEISTAKSGILSICADISPQSRKVTEVTEASFIGSYDNSKDEIQPGVIDEIINGNLLIEEYDKVNLDDGSMMRTVFDNSDITIDKGQDTKRFDTVPTSVIAGANPDSDFFLNDNMRSQVPFKEGELSRFDITIPLINTKEDMEKITDRMEIFGGGTDIEIGEIAQMMRGLSTRIESVEQIEWEEQKLQRTVKENFKALQKEINSNYRHELLIMRDLETLVRLVYIIGCIEEEIEDGKIAISEGTVSKAVSQFETLIDLRERLYTSSDRETLNTTPKDEIMERIYKLSEDGGKVRQDKVKDEVVGTVVGTKQTFYNKMDDLIREERVAYVGDKQRYKEVKPLAQ